MMFANRISSSTSCSIQLPETSPPSSTRVVLRQCFQSCNTSGGYSRYGLQFSAVLLGNFASKDCGDLVGLADGAISVEEALSGSIESRAPMEDGVVTILDLGKEQTMLAPSMLAFVVSEERGEGS